MTPATEPLPADVVSPADVTAPPAAPTNRDLLLIFATATLLRLLLVLASSVVYHVPISAHADRGDGRSYIAVAKSMAGADGEVTAFDRRVFPGLPMLIAVTHVKGVPWATSALALTALAAGAAAAGTASLCRDKVAGWAMAILTPHYLLYSSMVMNEGVLLAFVMAGLVVAVRRRRPVVGGALLGFAGVVRPVACFAVLGLLYWAARRRQWKQGGLVAVASLAVVVGGFLLAQHLDAGLATSVTVYRDDPGAYHGHLFSLPFESLVMTPLRTTVAKSKLAYVWLHVVAVLAAIAILVRRNRRGGPADEDTPTTLFTPWLIGNTAFVLCVGHVWGFHAFHRFATWALPPLLWAYRPWLPRRGLTWTAVAGGSFLIALASVMRN